MAAGHYAIDGERFRTPDKGRLLSHPDHLNVRACAIRRRQCLTLYDIQEGTSININNLLFPDSDMTYLGEIVWSPDIPQCGRQRCLPQTHKSPRAWQERAGHPGPITCQSYYGRFCRNGAPNTLNRKVMFTSPLGYMLGGKCRA